MTGGQSLLALDEAARERSGVARSGHTPGAVRPLEPLRVVDATAEELAAHAELAALLDKSSAGGCLWLEQEPEPARDPPSAARIHRS
jgi:DNA polymerase III subunit epsilon